MAGGTIIGEGLRFGAALEGIPLNDAATKACLDQSRE
jgi:hypothetical protein